MQYCKIIEKRACTGGGKGAVPPPTNKNILLRGILKIENGKKAKILAYMSPPGYPWVSSNKFSPFGSAVWSAIANIEMKEELYYID